MENIIYTSILFCLLIYHKSTRQRCSASKWFCNYSDYKETSVFVSDLSQQVFPEVKNVILVILGI